MAMALKKKKLTISKKKCSGGAKRYNQVLN
jgi:hypothetical protein